jgi:sarcosine oxidase gamma subunit
VVTSKGDSREAEKIIKFTNDGNQSKTLFDVDGCKIRISISNDKIEAVLNSAASGQ